MIIREREMRYVYCKYYLLDLYLDQRVIVDGPCVRCSFDVLTSGGERRGVLRGALRYVDTWMISSDRR